MKRKLKFLIPVPILLAVLVGAKMTVLKHKPAGKAKVNGALVQLADDFVVNLAGGHYGKLSIALLLKTAPPVSSTGTLPQNAAVRAVITDELTGLEPSQLIDRSSRHEVLARLKRALDRSTDEPVARVMFTDLAVQ